MKTKKSVITLLLLATMTFMLTACSTSGTTTHNDNAAPTQQTTGVTLPAATTAATTTVQPSTADPSKVNVIGLYMPDKASGVRNLTSGYTGEWTAGKDIASFEAFATKEPTIAGSNFKKVWESYWNSYPNSTGYKIGYYLTFTLNSSEVISKVMKGFEDTNDFRQYLEIYLYDDVHQIQGNWYSHLTTADTTPDSVCTSIKLTAGNKIADVKSISLTVFTYSSDKDFNPSTGMYTGTNSYTIPVSRNK